MKNKEIRKIIHGFVVQRWDAKTKEFLGQDFEGGTEEYEDEMGNSLDEDDVPEYRPTEMVQNPKVIG